MDLLPVVERTLQERSLVLQGQKVLIAFSGGADSTALLHLFCRLRESWGLQVSAAHLNHALRGADSDADEAHCRQVCADWRVPFFSRRVEVLRQAQERHVSVEMAAREVRYAFLEEVADAVEADVIALGHTRDDQIETVLLNLVRGAGIDGLAGMPMRRGRLVRPLLHISREQIRAYCTMQNLPSVEDLSNLDERYSRNRIRHVVLPQLRLLNSGVDSAIERLSVLAHDEEQWWKDYLRLLEPTFTLRRSDQEWQVSLEWLAGKPPALQRRVIRYVVRELSPEGRELQFEQVERLREAMNSGGQCGVTLHGGNVRVAVGKRTLRAMVKRGEVTTAYEMVVQLPGTTPVPCVHVTVYAEYSALPDASQWRRDNWEVWCDASQIRGRLVVRSWRQGDRLQPLGLSGHRKLSDIFIDRKVPPSLRRCLPIVCDDEGIVWVVGICLADRVRCTSETEQTVHLRAQPSGGW